MLSDYNQIELLVIASISLSDYTLFPGANILIIITIIIIPCSQEPS